MNVLAFVGMIKEAPSLKESSQGNKYATMQVEVERNFTNSNGIYESDKLTVTLWKGIAEQMSNICQLGDMVAVKGRLQSHDYEGKDGNLRTAYDIIAEQVQILHT